MKKFIRLYWKTLLFFTIAGLFGGFFVGLYLLDGYSAEPRQQLMEELSASGLQQIPVHILLGIITAVQSAGYGLVLGALGILLAKKVGLWKDETSITRKPLLISIAASVIGGIGMILPDLFFFGNYSEVIRDSYAVNPTIPYLAATVTYGAVIEEVMLRLFLMSLIVFILCKVFGKNQEKPVTKFYVISNIAAACLFAAGHIPATVLMIGTSPMIIFRCFLLNGGLGLIFGWFYRKYGLRYAMITHGGCHVVSKLI